MALQPLPAQGSTTWYPWAQALNAAVAGSSPVVVHGSNAATARPSTDLPVVWIGSVDPDNADDTLDVYIPVTAA